ncbi:ribonuclease [Herbihabitans rhizosphaerae]|uniref:Ribonuclease n=1 Tax=Herbihabitans rhizosphaerae TaxID=1872711 RepID=A0A4Q7KEZ2_9PSEU|nr:ribonuclease domain-containing protein [Herbihabitans rhizosphaerae]RZS31440.1 ribonuclease [Herbihabitans rhizosphaerae]
MSPRTKITAALVGLIVLALGGWLVKELAADSGSVPGSDSGLPVKALSSLPKEASDTWKLIDKGGPFPYDRDGVIFQNREKRLPDKDRDYYKEYTVKTPGSRDRGARRIIAGASREVYYTEDHYTSFVVVDVGK